MKKQLLYCALTLLASFGLVLALYLGNDRNAFSAFMLSVVCLPVFMLVVSGFSAYKLKDKDIYVPVISAVILIYILWLLANVDTFVVFGFLEAAAFLVGVIIGNFLRKSRKK